MWEIKFRAKVLGRDYQWVYGQYFITPLTDENSGEKIESGMYFLSGIDVKPHHCIVQNDVAFTIDINTLGQFIGLYDKNKKEIYEGDILKSLRKYTYMYDTGYKGHIRYRQHYADYEYGELGGQITQAKAKFCEIIGNIHDNPELLS
jgi:uncharacterized phage protein (TIGR01671 family)